MADRKTEMLRKMVRERFYSEALAACDDAMLEKSGSDRGGILLIKADILRRFKRYDESVEAASMAVDPEPDEPTHLFDRARTRIEMGAYRDAVSDFDRVIEIEDRAKTEIYVDAARLLAAVCFKMLGRPEDVLRLCEDVPENASVWALGTLQTREHLASEACEKLGSSS